MPKRRCKKCGKYTETFVRHPIGTFCTQKHALQFAVDKNRKASERQYINAQRQEKKKHAKRKREFYETDIKTRKAAARKACHLYIRKRDKNEACICCGRPLGKNYDAGHWLESGNNPKLRYNEDNIHAQSVYCNQYQGGNSRDYESRLRAKIGDERTDELLANRGGTMQRTAQDYKEIEDYYRAKLKGIEQ